MEWLKVFRISGCIVVIFSAYLYGQHQGRNSEELKQARSEVVALQTTVRSYEAKNKEYLLAMAELRIAESAARFDAERMRQRIDRIATRAKSTESRITVRHLRLEAEGAELLKRADGIIEYCRRGSQ